MKQSIAVATLLAVLTVSPLHASPDAQDDAVARQCPAATAWLQAHPASADGDDDAEVAQRDAKRHISEPTLRQQLLQREAVDQQVRKVLIAKGTSATPADTSAMLKIDQANLAWLKPQVTAHGVPTIAQIGEQGMDALWILIQHADSDPAFQVQMLEALKPRLATRDIRPSDYAMLTDRVLRAQGKPQRYGSQFIRDPQHPGAFAMAPTEDMAHLDQRRAQMELMPIEDYTCAMKVVYGGSAKAATTTAAAPKPAAGSNSGNKGAD